jgi:hypothetical protein
MLKRLFSRNWHDVLWALLIIGARDSIQLLRALETIKRAKLVLSSVKAHMFITGTPDTGADGKDYRANSVHAPFSEKSARQAPP